MPRTPKIFFVSHPYTEPKVKGVPTGATVTIPWNTGSLGCGGHCRKFIKRNGHFLDSKGVHKQDSLLFWAEYEPPSTATIIGKHRPKAVHDPLTAVRGRIGIPKGALNTDPYVFGNHFKYICCGIGNKKFVHGDMILFGYYRHPNILDLDTVVIVDKAIPINHTRTSSQYYNAAIRPMGKKPNIFYQGVAYAPGIKFFSFVPCILHTDIASIPSHPKIDLSKMGFVINKGWRSHVAKGIPFTPKAWNYVTGKVQRSKWLLGTHIDKI